MGACCLKKEKKEIVDTPEVVVPIKMVSITKNDEERRSLYEISCKRMRRIKRVQSFLAEYKVIKDLGKGSFGTVVSAQSRVTGQIRAIKMISKSKMSQSRQTKNLLK